MAMLPTLRNRFVTPSLFEPSFFEPWGDLRREIDRVFETVLSGARPMAYGNGNGDMGWMPPMDVEEKDDLIRLSFELPGVKPEDVNVTVENGVLTVSGEKKYERESADESKGSRMVERRYGRFERALPLPQSVDADRGQAHYHHGVLTLELPKSAESRRRKIEIGRRAEPKQLEGRAGNGSSQIKA
jgi:HSP20 family protein